MKKLIFVLLFVAAIFGGRAIKAAPVNVSTNVLLAFKTTFPTAENARWYEGKEVYIVHFAEEGKEIKAFYNKDGSFICTYKYLRPDETPPKLIKHVGKRFYPSTIKAILEIADKEKHKLYYFTLEGPKDYKTVKAGNNSSIEVVQRLQKR